jgi:hypothetical protein
VAGDEVVPGELHLLVRLCHPRNGHGNATSLSLVNSTIDDILNTYLTDIDSTVLTGGMGSRMVKHDESIPE